LRQSTRRSWYACSLLLLVALLNGCAFGSQGTVKTSRSASAASASSSANQGPHVAATTVASNQTVGATASATPVPSPTAATPPTLQWRIGQPDGEVTPTDPLRLTFSQPMDQASVQQALTIKPAVPGTTSWQGSTMTFTPAKPWPDATLVSLSIGSGAHAADGQPLPTAHDWSFVTEPKFQALEVSPAPGATYVPSDAVINVTFSHQPAAATVAPNVNIVPPLAGAWQVNGRIATFVPARPLPPSTVFAVALGAGVRDATGRPLLAGKQWQFTTAQPPSKDTRHIYVAGQRIVFAPLNGQHQVAFSTYQVPSVALTVYRVPSVGAFLAAYTAKQANGGMAPVDVGKFQRLSSFSAALPHPEQDTVGAVSVPGADSTGIYYVDESAIGDNAEGQFLVVSDRGLLVQQSPTGVLVWLTTLAGGTPLAGASVTVVDANSGQRLLSGTTGADGAFQGALALQPQPHGPAQPPNLLAISGSGSELTIGGNADAFFGGGYVAAPAAYQLYAYTDRPIYRPGDVVHLRGVVRRDNDVHYALPGSIPVHISLTGPLNGTTLLDRQVTLDAAGNFALDIPLASDLAGGDYNFAVSSTTSQTAPQDNYYGSFQVAEYRKPAYAVTVSAPNQPWVSGDRIPVTVNARYYFDQPVAGGKVTLRVLTSDWYDPTAPGAVQQDPEQAERGGYQGGAFGALVGSYSGTLDADGNATFGVPADLGTATLSQRYALEATVADAANDPVTNAAALIVHRGALVLYGQPAAYATVLGQPLPTTFTVDDLQQRPVAGVAIRCDVVQQTYDVTQQGGPKGAYPVYKLVEVPAYQFAATSGSEGSVVAPLVLPQASPYRVGCSVQDQRGNTVKLDLYLWAADSSGALAPYAAAGDRLTVLADKQVYAVGDVAHLQVLSPLAGLPALVTVARGSIYRHQVIQLTGKSTRFDLPITADDLPNVALTVAVQGQGRTLTGAASLRVPATSRYLHVQLTTDRQQYAPGEKANVRLQATGPDGKPAQGLFSLGMVDEAIYALARQTPPTIKAAFYGARAVQLRTGASLDAAVGRNGGGAGGGGGGGGGQGQVRTDFPDTGYWSPAVQTDADGKATVQITMPDSLTTWRLTAIGATALTDVGYVTDEVVSTKALHVDPAFPRFLISGDHLSLTATLTNATGGAVAAAVTLSSPALQPTAPATQRVLVPAHGSQMVRWAVTVGAVGNAAITLQAGAGGLADAVKISIPVLAGGATAGVTSAGEAGTQAVALDLPAAAIAGSAALQLAVTPSLAGGVLAAGRYLSAYPYACAEQTVSSFLPVILANQAYAGAGLTALQQQLPPDLSGQVETSLQQLYSLQHADGGWNWWSYDQTDPYMTAYVVYGLVEAKRLGYPVVQSSLDRGIVSLQHQLDPSSAGLATAAYMLDVLALAGKPVSAQSSLVQGLLARHTAMADYGESYLAQYFVAVNDLPDARTLLAGLSNEATQTSTTAAWKEQVDLPPLRGSLIYSTAVALDAYTLLDPSSQTALKAARYLLASRSGDAWNSTHDSAMATMALNRYLLAHGDFAASGHVSVVWNGQVLQTIAVSPTTPPLTLHLAARQIQAQNSLQVTSDGSTPVFWSAALTYHLTTAPASSPDLSIARRYVLADGTPVSGALPVGTPLQVMLTVRNAAPLDYVQVRDALPAGLEALNPALATSQSQTPAAQRPDDDQRDYRDQEVDFFVTKLAPGDHTFTYAAQTSSVGVFQAPSATVSQMYVPSVRASSVTATVVVRP
jgi:uncharacterized protein YfaS (alpha-2-macroglobulin family)